MIWQLAVLSFGFATGLMLVAYKDYAQSQGWPIGAMLAKPLSWPGIFGLIAMIFAFGRSFFILESWLGALLVPVIGFVLGFLLILVLRSWSPLFALIAGVVIFLATPTLVGGI